MPLLNTPALLTQGEEGEVKREKYRGKENNTGGELKRGEASLIYPFPLSLAKGKGDGVTNNKY